MTHPVLPNGQSAFFDLPMFQVQITNLSPGERLPLMVSIPPRLRVKNSNYGINTYRANAVVYGEIEFTRDGALPVTKVAGESPQDARVAHSGEYWVKAMNDEPATFACVVAKSPAEYFYDYEIIKFEPGQTHVIAESDKVSNLFLMEGNLALTDTDKTFDAFHHFEVTPGKKPSFTEVKGTTAILIRVINIGVEGARALVSRHFPENAADFAFM